MRGRQGSTSGSGSRLNFDVAIVRMASHFNGELLDGGVKIRVRPT